MVSRDHQRGFFWAAFDLFEVAQLVVRATISYLERLHIRDMDLRLRGGRSITCEWGTVAEAPFADKT